MTIYTLHIFDNKGSCLFDKEWVRNKTSSLPKEQEIKLMFGMIHSINSFVSKMSPCDFKDGFLCFSTNKYKLHFYETSSGMKFVLMTDIAVGSMRDTLKKLYSKVYVEYIVRNPLINLSEPIVSSLFESKMEAFISELSCFGDNQKQN